MRAKYMFMFFILFMAMLIIIFTYLFNFNRSENTAQLPTVAIANFGPHSSLQESIEGIKESLVQHGYIDKKNIKIEIMDVGFDRALIPQMITKLQNQKPALIITMSTPVTQYAKMKIKNTPLIYNVITEPIASGLEDMVGSSDKQDLASLLQFAKKLLPKAGRVGMLYSTSENNDLALLNMMQQAVLTEKMELVAIPIDDPRDIQLKMGLLKNRVDFIYVGASGPILPSLPIIAIQAKKMAIPIINVDSDAVKQGLVLASFGVSYKKVGMHAGTLAAKLLNHVPMTQLQAVYPSLSDHHGMINIKQAKYFTIALPKNLENITLIQE